MIGIIAAMESEMAYFRERLEGLQASVNAFLEES